LATQIRTRAHLRICARVVDNPACACCTMSTPTRVSSASSHMGRTYGRRSVRRGTDKEPPRNFGRALVARFSDSSGQFRFRSVSVCGACEPIGCTNLLKNNGDLPPRPELGTSRLEGECSIQLSMQHRHTPLTFLMQQSFLMQQCEYGVPNFPHRNCLKKAVLAFQVDSTELRFANHN
jgi:hypothetical protein